MGSIKNARDAFWEDYKKRQERIQQNLDEAYCFRKKAKDAEWVLNPQNRRKSLGSIIFSGIYLHQFGGSKQFNAYIEDLQRQQQTLREEAQIFKAHSRHAVNVLKTQTLALEIYTDSLSLMQEMADDVYMSGASALEYWAQQHVKRNQLRLPGTPRLEDMLKHSRERIQQKESLYQAQPVDWAKRL